MSSIAGPSRLPAYSRSRQPSYYEARAPRSSSIPTWFSPPPPHARSVSVVRSVHRSSSVFSQRSYTSHSYQQDEQIKAELDRKRSESVRKLKSTWEQISEKYGKIQVEDDDEIDIYTGQIVRDRGRIQRMKEERDFGVFLSEDEADAEDENSSFIFDEDEDELGAWDARSGLDRQWASDQEDGPKEPPWTVEDDKDLQEFLRMEQARKETMGEASGSEDEPEVDGKDRRPSPRRHGPKSDTDSNGSHSSLPVRSRRYPISDDSDDELLARTSDAEEGTRVTYVDSSEDEADLPLLAPLPRSRVEVVIPKWTGARSYRATSSPTLPIHHVDSGELNHGVVGAESHQSSPSPILPSRSITLQDLFTPEPELSSATATTTKPFAQEFDAQSATMESQRQSRTVDKGKGRMVGERPSMSSNPGDIDPEHYFRNVQRSNNGVSLRVCKLCLHSEGVRHETAPWCRGRVSSSRCVFAMEALRETSIIKDHMTLPRPTADREVPDRRELRHQQSRTTGHMASGSNSDPASENDRSPSVSKSQKHRQHSQQSPHALQNITADFKSASRGTDDGDSDEESEYSRDQPSHASSSIRYGSEITTLHGIRLSIPPGEILDPKRYHPTVIYKKRLPGPRVCRHCRDASGDRRRNAFFCRGRSWGKWCSFEEDTQPEAARDTPARASRSRSRDGSVPVPGVRRSVSATERRPGSISDQAKVEVRAGSSTMPSTRKTSKNRKRIMSTASVSPGLDLRNQTGDGPISPLIPDVATLLSGSPMPPSSPPVMPASLLNDRSYLASTGRPTPSPSLSRTGVLATPGRMGYDARQSPLPRQIAPLRSSAYRPTPPLSDGWRETPVSNNCAPSSFLRRGILRLASDKDSSSVGSSSKRARFTEEPSSPIRYDALRPIRLLFNPTTTTQEDELPGDESDDDPLLLASDKSMSPSPEPPSSDRSTGFPREMSVRAADVGYDLGTRLTGKLPSRILDALVPALSTQSLPPKVKSQKATLGSSVITADGSRIGAGYALPTPPRSFDSTSSRNTYQAMSRTPAKGTLMLPPPVPIRSGSTRLNTPVSIQDEATKTPIIKLPRPKSMSVMNRRTTQVNVAQRKSYPATSPRVGKTKARVVSVVESEWGMDEDAGEEHGRLWRESSMVRYI